MKKSKIKSNPSKTILTISIGFLVVFLLLENKLFLQLSLIIGLIGIFSIYLSEKVEYLWFKLAELLGFIVPNIILSIVFYLFLFPISILSKLFSDKDLLKLKQQNKSTYIKTVKKFDSKSFENPW